MAIGERRKAILRLSNGVAVLVVVAVAFTVGRTTKSTSINTSPAVETTIPNEVGDLTVVPTSMGTDIGVDLNTAKTMIELESYDEAQSILDKVLAVDPTNYIALYNSGLIAQQRGDYETAVNRYTEGLLVKPDYHSSIYNRGLAYLSLGDTSRAIADLLAATKLAPDWVKGKYYLGKAYLADGQTAKGEQLMNGAVSLDPSLEP